ncbi:MAG: anti-sigma factor family protein [Candidatus Polarisedimenticolia bacterium]
MGQPTPHLPEGCKDAIGLLTEYMEGALSPPLVRALEAHLTGCSACDGFLVSLRRTRDAVGRLRAAAMPEEMHRRLHAFLDARRRGHAQG